MADEDAHPEELWHDLLAEARKHGYRILQIDALEGLALCAARADRSDEAARLAGAAARAREEYGYRYRYPHLAELAGGSDEGRALTLVEATAYARRARGERRRPITGWQALTRPPRSKSPPSLPRASPTNRPRSDCS
jgi:hypothetical protein